MAASPLVQRAADRVVVVALVLGFAAASAALAARTGAWGLPHNDDWAMLRIAQRLAETGEVRLVGCVFGGVVRPEMVVVLMASRARR